MIELNKIKITSYDNIIEMRNKIYRLAKDLQVKPLVTTSLATLASEVLSHNLKTQKHLQVILAFTKENGAYYLNILLESSPDAFSKYQNKCLYTQSYQEEINDKHYFKLLLQIKDTNFIPDKKFLQEERERLIQQSSSEMLYEIRRKNDELNKALQDLKSSGEMIHKVRV